MSEQTYTLDEARATLARQECAAHGHDWDIIMGGFGVPTRIACARCRCAYGIASQIPHNTCTITVAREIAERFEGKWTRVVDIEADWFTVTLNGDGTAEVLLSRGDKPPVVA